MASLVSDVEAAVARPILPHDPALKLLVDYLQIARDGEALTTPDLQRIAVTHICDLLAVALGTTRDATEIARGRGMRSARLRSAKAFIARTSDARFVTRVCGEKLGITARYLHMLFEIEGLSFTKFVIENRLAFSHGMLLDPRHGEPPSAPSRLPPVQRLVTFQPHVPQAFRQDTHGRTSRQLRTYPGVFKRTGQPTVSTSGKTRPR